MSVETRVTKSKDYIAVFQGFHFKINSIQNSFPQSFYDVFDRISHPVKLLKATYFGSLMHGFKKYV